MTLWLPEYTKEEPDHFLTREAKSSEPGIATNSKWTNIGDRLSKQQKRRVIGRILKLLIQTIFGKYIYSFGEDIFRQLSGGPIGDSVTVVVSRIATGDWMEKMSKILIAQRMSLC